MRATIFVWGAVIVSNTAIDYGYDKLKKTVGNAIKAGVDWIGSLWE